jgi:hypothetical protein
VSWRGWPMDFTFRSTPHKPSGPRTISAHCTPTALRYRGARQRPAAMFNPSASPTQGISQHPFALSPTSPTSTRGFKRSASSDDDQENGDGDTRPSSSRRNTAVKRACNECRQQKVRLCAPEALCAGARSCCSAGMRPCQPRGPPDWAHRIATHRTAPALCPAEKASLSATPLTYRL